MRGENAKRLEPSTTSFRGTTTTTGPRPFLRPVLALDRIYSMNAEVKEVYSHNTPSARRASDHLPVVARVKLPLRITAG